MNEFSLIRDIALIWAVALITGHICIRLKQPVIAGYMLSGLLVGPHVLKLISQPEQITVLADFGVAMLLFALGVDLSLKQVIASARRILSASLAQVILTLIGAWIVASVTGLAANTGEGFLFGSVCAISSSVVISRTLIDRGELDSVHGRILVPLSLVQDLCLVVIIPFLPVLQASTNPDLSGVLLSALKAGLFVLLIVVGATKAVPPLLARSAKSNSKEIFLLTVLVLCLGIALLSQFLGLSIALGAFLAGIMMSESVYAHQALHDVSPLRDVFSTIFFVSVGMLLDPAFIGQHLIQVLTFVVVLIAGKALIGTAAALLATNNLRSAILVGIGVSQIGEFSFVLLTLGYGYGLINQSMYNLFFAGAVVSMMATPALMLVVPRLMLRHFRGAEKPTEETDSPSGHSSLNNHVIICGFGRIGRNLGLVLESFKIPFIVVELNASIIEDLAVRGIPHIYGDAMSQIVLVKARLKQAASLVLTMPDPLSAEAVAAFARDRNPQLKIVARAHRSEDIRVFRLAGVNAVVQPEFEASIEITRLVLHSLNRPSTEIHDAMKQIRTRRYAIFQPDIDNIEPGAHLEFGDDQMGIWFRVASERTLVGKSLRNLDVRSKTGATIMAVKSKGRTTAFPDPAVQLEMDDEVYVVGNFDQLHTFEHYFAFRAQTAKGDIEAQESQGEDHE